MRSKIESILLLFTFITLPTQLSKHFWPGFTRIEAIRVDYLAPSIYLSDITILLFILISFLNKKKIFAIKINKIILLSLALLLTTLLYHAFFAKSPQAALYGSLKLAEFILFGYCLTQLNLQKITKLLTYSFLIIIPFQSILAASQFVKQETIGGFWYFFGERSFTAYTPGIATFFINGKEILRPYATFSHPNVLAFYLLFANIFLLTTDNIKSKTLKYYKSLIITISSIVLLLTFSRGTIFLYLVFWLVWSLVFIKKRLQKLVLSSIIIVSFMIFILFFHTRFLDTLLIQKDIMLRSELNQIALSIWEKSPLFGVGLKNFFIYQIEFQKSITPTLLQPVHNIYLLTLAEAGIFGLIALLQLMFQALLQQFKNKSVLKSPVFFALISAAVVGLFDHYLLTVQQGQLIFTILIALGFAKNTTGVSHQTRA